ncbi:MAG: hypothetical protein MR436_04015 [Eubacterium sp.]|nr:hypothetical protein [Eubacterium sp.]
MKKCSNPNCESEFLFSDSKSTCPFCHSMLITSDAMATARHILPADSVDYGLNNNEEENDVFLSTHLGNMECHGRIVEIDHHEIFNSKWHKLFNSLFRDEPYQLANQTIEYTIRVENITDDFSTEITDFCMYGSYLGRLQVGDEVRINAKNKRNRRIVKKLYNETTGSAVKPGLQIPSIILKISFALVILALISLASGLVWFVKSGMLLNVIESVLIAFLPLIIMSVGIWMLVRSVFPKRRRRR